jgi:hypothetical protein
MINSQVLKTFLTTHNPWLKQYKSNNWPSVAKDMGHQFVPAPRVRSPVAPRLSPSPCVPTHYFFFKIALSHYFDSPLTRYVMTPIF